MTRIASRLTTTLALLALVATGCSGDRTAPGADADATQPTTATASSTAPAPSPPQPFPAARADVPSGYTRARCSDLRGKDNSGLAVSLVVPVGYQAVSRDDTSCGFAAGSGREFYVSFGGGPSLRTEKERDVDPFVDTGGDDSVSDVRYAADVPVFGTHRGELLAYYCFCDGQDLEERIVQGRGVRLTWTTRHDHSSHPAAYRAVTAGMALVRGDTSTCRSRGRTLVFRPPIPQTDSIDFGGGECHLYLRPGRASLLRYAEIAVRPARSLAALAARLRARGSVSAVRWEPGVAMLAGRTADRLTWTITRTHPTQDYQPAGTWRAVALGVEGPGTDRLRVTWSATPRQWRTERRDAAAFFRSVR